MDLGTAIKSPLIAIICVKKNASFNREPTIIFCNKNFCVHGDVQHFFNEVVLKRYYEVAWLLKQF